MKIGLIDLVQEGKHQAPPGHPENAHRVTFAVNHVLNSDIAQNLVSYKPNSADALPLVQRIHEKSYIALLKAASEQGGGFLDADTYVTENSFDVAIETAAAGIAAIDDIASGKFKRIFVSGRPPGHHAEHNRGMGFCLINNTAVAAEAALVRHKMERVAIIDWDVHHGNGTQHTFYDRDDVFYISLHRYPFYPGSGATAERGEGKGTGYTLNVPLPQGSKNGLFYTAFREKIIPALEKYRPEVIIITCGFDAHRDDPLGGMDLDETAFGEMTRQLVEVADNYAGGRILSFFEGGYSLSGNAVSLYCHLKELIKE